jgi:IS605 OrfB family transposase
VFYSRPLPAGCKIHDGSCFSEDAEGHWYLNLVIEIPELLINFKSTQPAGSVGIDLGLKDFAVLSTGEVIEAPKFYRKLESKLGINQHANKKKQVRKLHAKIKNARKDFHHKLSTRLVKEFEAIAVGNVKASSLARTKMAKSVLDAGWSSFRTMLCYKAIRHGVYYEEVKENFTTQTCSSCGNKTGPKGLSGLGVRFWKCSQCTAIHNRDCNAAKNIQARLGHQTL